MQREDRLALRDGRDGGVIGMPHAGDGRRVGDTGEARVVAEGEGEQRGALGHSHQQGGPFPRRDDPAQVEQPLFAGGLADLADRRLGESNDLVQLVVDVRCERDGLLRPIQRPLGHRRVCLTGDEGGPRPNGAFPRSSFDFAVDVLAELLDDVGEARCQHG